MNVDKKRFTRGSSLRCDVAARPRSSIRFPVREQADGSFSAASRARATNSLRWLGRVGSCDPECRTKGAALYSIAPGHRDVYVLHGYRPLHQERGEDCEGDERPENATGADAILQARELFHRPRGAAR